MSAKHTFVELYVKAVSKCLQNHMNMENIPDMTADACAIVLDSYGILKIGLAGPPGAPAFMFRQLLRDGRDGLIPLVTGGEQATKRGEWIIRKV
jgi:hypothetical protein